MSEAPKKLRGFAAMSPERRRELASRGGKATPPEKRAFSRSPALAQSAGTKGGKAVPSAKRTYAKRPDIAQRAGTKGGRAKKRKAG